MSSVSHMKVLETKSTPLPSIQPILDDHGVTLSKAYKHPDVSISEPGKAQPYMQRLKRLCIINDGKFQGAIFKCERHGDFTCGFWIAITKTNFVSAHLCENTLTDKPIVYKTWTTIEDGWLPLDATTLPLGRITLHVFIKSALMMPHYAAQEDYVVYDEVRNDIERSTSQRAPKADHRLIVGGAMSGKTWKVQEWMLEQKRGIPIAIITPHNPWANPQVNLSPCVQDIHFYPTWSAYWIEAFDCRPRESIVVIDDITCLSKAAIEQITPLLTSQKGIQFWFVAQSLKQVPASIRYNSRIVEPTLKLSHASESLIL